jgi:hypothetical protein
VTESDIPATSHIGISREYSPVLSFIRRSKTEAEGKNYLSCRQISQVPDMRSSVNVLAMADVENRDGLQAVIDLVNDAVITAANSVAIAAS